MKIIAKISHSKWIAEVEQGELEKFFNLYYNKMEEITVGKEYDLGSGYDHAREIASAVEKFDRLIENAEDITKAMKTGRLVKKRQQTA